MTSEMEDYLVEFFDIEPAGKKESRQDFLNRVADAGREENCPEKKWLKLEKDDPEAFQWMVDAQNAQSADEDIEDFPDLAEADDESADEGDDDSGDEGDDEGDDAGDDEGDADPEPAPRSRRGGRRAADDGDDADAEEPQTRGRGGRRGAAAEQTEDEPQRGRGGRRQAAAADDAGDDDAADASNVDANVRHQIKKLVAANPSITAAEILKKVKTKISTTAVNYIKTETKDTMKVLTELKWKKPASR